MDKKMKGEKIELPEPNWDHDFRPFYCFMPNGKADRLARPRRDSDISPELLHYIKTIEDRLDSLVDIINGIKKT